MVLRLKPVNGKSISNRDLEYNNSDDEIILENEEEEIGISSHSENGRIYPMKTIKVDKGFYTVYELKRKYDKKPSLVILDSDFQRKDVWNLQQKRELIESVLMGLPLPIFYFNQDKKGRLVVIDGRQRLTSLFEFIDDKNGFALDKLKILPELNKLKFKKLDPALQSKIEDYQIMAHVIQPPTPDEIKFDIFDRVNRAGTQLNKQEIRNALYQGESTILLSKICKTESFQMATDYAFKYDKRMKDRLLVLRFIAFYLYFNKTLYITEGQEKKLYKYPSNADEMLGLTMDYLNSLEEDNIESLFSLTIKALDNVYYYLGENAFRLINMDKNGKPKRFPININIFETIMYGMTLIVDINREIRPKIKKQVCDLINEMKSSAGFRDSLNNHRDSEPKVDYRFKEMTQICNRILGLAQKGGK